MRIAEGGEPRDRIDVAGYSAFACALGGSDATTLFLCESTVLGAAPQSWRRAHPHGRRDVPGVGTP